MKKQSIAFQCAIVLLLLASSCKKDVSNAKNPDNENSSISNVSETDKPGAYYDKTSGIHKLVLQPDNNNGQDAWLDWNINDPFYANVNTGYVEEFKVVTWTISGTLIKNRAVLGFSELSQIPVGSKILSAKFYLYGLSNSPDHLPQGNSNYPGSPYNEFGDNSILVQRATSAWDESTVTWNTQPSVTLNDLSIIAPSKTQWNNNSSCDVTEMVKQMIKTPTTNNGFVLKFAKEELYRSMGYYTSEYSVASKRPKLIVVYK